MASLQCGFGADDDVASIRENRRRAAAAILPTATGLASLKQVHGTAVVHARAPFAEDERPEADALVTDRPGVILAVLAADCAPILLADAEAGVVGAAHAGWKGALAGVTDAVIAGMERLGADRARIAAAIGPAIAQRSYEVDDAFRRRFETDAPENAAFFKDGRPGHHQFDLEAYNAARLADAGLRNIHCTGEDTYAQAERFYSYRRATHAARPDYGRQISLIALPES
jgi:YfiH family protein